MPSIVPSARFARPHPRRRTHSVAAAHDFPHPCLTVGQIREWGWWPVVVSVASLYAVVCLVFLTRDDASDHPISHIKLSKSLISTATSRTSPQWRSFIDPVWLEWGSEVTQFQTLVPPSEIDYTIERRLPWNQPNNQCRNKCDDILLFMPDYFARNGHGSQLNSYLLAAMLASFMGKAMVLFDAPQKYSKYPNGSQFGCPVDAFKNADEFLRFKGQDHSHLEMRPDFPTGLSRLIVHPKWISRDCPVPKCKTFDFGSWDTIRKRKTDYLAAPREFTCKEVDGPVKVVVMGGEEVRQFFSKRFKKMMLDRSNGPARERAYHWAVRLGATHYQAEAFSFLSKESHIWDYLSALLGRSGLVTFQPWIARDVKEFIKVSKLPLDSPHDSIHVRRGDKLDKEAREEVVNYWHSQGYERQVDFPLNYIPFSHYLRLWEMDCENVWSGSSKENKSVRTIYVATDDPITVKKEISKLPRGHGGTTIVGGCERVKFVFSPDASHGSLHISDGGIRIDCVERYKRNIHSIADLMVLTKSNTFVGELNSNWGRIIRIFRTHLNDMYVIPDKSFGWANLLGLHTNEKETEISTEPPVLIHDMRLAFSEDKVVPPPGW